MMRATVKVPENVYCRNESPRQMRVGSSSPTTNPMASSPVMAKPLAVQSGQVACATVQKAAPRPAAATTHTKRCRLFDRITSAGSLPRGSRRRRDPDGARHPRHGGMTTG